MEIFKYIIENIISIGLSSGIIIFFVNKISSQIKKKKKFHKLKNNLDDIITRLDNFIMNENDKNQIVKNGKIPFFDISFTDSNFIEKKFDIILIKNNILLKNIKKTSKHLTKSKLKSFIFNYWKQ